MQVVLNDDTIMLTWQKVAHCWGHSLTLDGSRVQRQLPQDTANTENTKEGNIFISVQDMQVPQWMSYCFSILQ